ncbi:MAG: glutamate racemase, partial [Janthinobacterium lividum]
MAPVGVFDSGVGGLSVLRAIRQELPEESLLYCADSRYAPYGERSNAFLVDRSLAIGGWLIERGAKALVVACNTATTHAIAELRAAFPVPIVGVEPGIKPATRASRSGVVGVLATAATLRSGKFQHLLATHAGDRRLVCIAGVGLVEAIEQGDTGSPALAALLATYLQPMLDADADTLALGCTHYPFLIPLIRSLVGERLHIIDNSTPVARQLGRL